jgi:hypothetical protein
MENVIDPGARDTADFMDPANSCFTKSNESDIDLRFIFFETQLDKIFNC